MNKKNDFIRTSMYNTQVLLYQRHLQYRQIDGADQSRWCQDAANSIAIYKAMGGYLQSNGKTSYFQILQNLEAATSLWDLTGDSVVMLPRHVFYFRAMLWL